MQYNPLKHNELIKRGDISRLENFIKMMKEGKLFTTTKGLVILSKSQVLKNNKKVNPTELFEFMKENGFSATFTGKKENNQVVNLNYPKDFFKTPEFGGKGVGSGTAAEDYYLNLFEKELTKTLLKEKSPYIKIKVANKRIVKVSSVISTPKGLSKRDPKADFILVDPDGKYVGFISHKKGSKPTDFQQYGGLSDSAFANIIEVKKFVAELARIYPKGLVSGMSVKRNVKNKDVILKSIYGVDYGAPSAGIQNVDEFHQGEMKLNKRGTHYTIDSNHKGVNGEMINVTGYKPIYYARYTGDRGATIAGIFINNARIGVFPEAKAANTAIEL
jgi:hypothetical protein